MDSELNDLVVYFISIIVILVVSILLHGCTIRVIANQQYDIERERTQIIESYRQGLIDGVGMTEQEGIENTY